MNTSYLQSSFLSGEWSQAFQGNIDRKDYRTGCNLQLNTIPIEAGSSHRRPGTRFLQHTRAGSAGRLVKFDFSQHNPYNIELTDGYLRFFSGVDLVRSNDAQRVSNISAATPAVVTTAGTHGWPTGRYVMFSDLGLTSPLLQNRQFIIIQLSATTFSIADAITGASIDGSTLGWVAPALLPSVPMVECIAEIASPYTSGIWSDVRSVQAELQSFLLHTDKRPQVLTVNRLPSDAFFAELALTTSFFKDGPYLDPVSGGTLVTPSALTGIITLTLGLTAYSATKAYTVGDLVISGGINYVSLADANLNNAPAGSPTKWAITTAGHAINSGNGFQATDVGRHVRLYSEPALWAVGTAYVAGNVVAYAGVYWTCLVGNTGNIPGNDTVNWTLTPANAAIWSWGIVTGLANLIDPALAGSLNIGNLTSGGGVAVGFDTIITQDDLASASKVATRGGIVVPQSVSTSGRIGKNYSGASAQAIGSATLFPSSGSGLFSTSFYLTVDPTTILGTVDSNSYTINLRGKHTAPASDSDGTLLGTTGPLTATQLTAVTVNSTDTVTAWEYVWFEILLTSAVTPNPEAILGGGQTLKQTLFAAEVQFFSPPSPTGSGLTVELLGPNLLYTTPIRVWRLGLFSDTTGWPTCGTYHEGRLWLSGAVDNRFDSSVSNDLQNFAPTASDGTVAGNNGITYILNAPDVNPIFWMVPDQQGIICGTQAGEWLVQATAVNAPLTPTTVQAHRVTSVGCANIEPKRTEHTTVFVQKHGRKIMEYFPDVYSGKFSAPNLSEKAKHLTVGNVLEIAYQQELAPIIWARRGDGALIGATYKRNSLVTSQGPDFIAWHHHTLGSGRTVESIVVGPSTGGNLDTLAMVTNGDSVRHVEAMTDLLDETADIKTCWFLDDAVIPTSYSYTALGASMTINGLWHLNGKTVSVFAGGLDCGQHLVTAGSCTVAFGDGVTAGTAGGLFTSAYADSFGPGLMPIVVGFANTTRGQILRPATQVESGTQFGPGFGKVRRSHQLMALLSNTSGISFGTSFAALRPALFKSDGGIDYTPLQLFSGIYRDRLDDGYSFDSMLCWQASGPYPASVCALGAFLATQDE